jgi:hypothetical protein
LKRADRWCLLGPSSLLLQMRGGGNAATSIC